MTHKRCTRLGGGRPVVLGYGAPQLRRQGLRLARVRLAMTTCSAPTARHAA
ncbi:MAG: hypothetical protein ACLRIS_03055 [Flavonifractor plautii]